jgi:hypothetical protein
VTAVLWESSLSSKVQDVALEIIEFQIGDGKFGRHDGARQYRLRSMSVREVPFPIGTFIADVSLIVPEVPTHSMNPVTSDAPEVRNQRLVYALRPSRMRLTRKIQHASLLLAASVAEKVPSR